MSTISDLSVDVIFGLGGRSDLQARSYSWLKQAYLEIGSNCPLETLEASEDNLTVYGIDAYDYPATARAIKVLSVVLSAGQTIPIRKRSMQVIDQYPGPDSNMTGLPCIWAPFANQLFLRPVPNGSYTLRQRFWRKPTIETVVETTELLVPDDWLEVLVLAAVARGHIALNERDKANQIQTLLHGDPAHQQENPGLIKTKLRRQQAEAGYDGWATKPKIRAYT